MKVYDRQWFTTFGMTPEAAAGSLAADGIDTIIAQNRIDPLPSSGVDQVGYLSSAGDRLTSYSDRAWVEALKRNGIHVLQTTATLFDPPALDRFPDARPIDADGNPDTGVDWYVGICPTHEGYLAEKIAKLERVTAELEPDGLFLQFIRYPGFWENWTWAPDYRFSNKDRYCFCDRCRSLFARDNGLSLPNGGVAEQAAYILNDYASQWTAWRCVRIVQIVERVAAGINAIRPDVGITLNTLPFPSSDFKGGDVRARIAGQDLSALARSIERFELMTYLQILNRPISWVSTAVADVRSRLPTGREVVCTLQVDALYTDGMHAQRMRKQSVTADELEAAAAAALDAGADGLVFYHWTDFLVDEAAGGRKREVLRAITGA